jgi:hypothetical protein
VYGNPSERALRQLRHKASLLGSGVVSVQLELKRANAVPRHDAVVRGLPERRHPQHGYEEGGDREDQRYLTEGEPKLQHLAEITTSLAERAD